MASRSKKIKRKLGAVIYYSVASKLPPSWSGMKLGQTAIRRFCGRLMLDKCGSNVNIEKNALFSPKTTLGNNSGIGINAKIYGECHIGDDVMMGTDVTVITRNHKHERTDIPMRLQGFEEEKPVYIGKTYGSATELRSCREFISETGALLLPAPLLQRMFRIIRLSAEFRQGSFAAE